MDRRIPTALPAHRDGPSRRRFWFLGIVAAALSMAAIGIFITFGPPVIPLTPMTPAGRAMQALSDLSVMKLAIEMYARDAGDWPPQKPGLSLLEQPCYRGPYISPVPSADPWGNAYTYQRFDANRRPRIISFGADGTPGGTGINADVIVYPVGPP